MRIRLRSHYSFFAATKIIQDRASIHTKEQLWRRDFCVGWRVTYRIGSVPYLGAVSTPVRPVAEVNRTLRSDNGNVHGNVAEE